MIKTPLAWRILTNDKARLAFVIAGVGGAVTLMFMQLGLLAAVESSAIRITDKLDFDLVLVSPN